MDTLNGLLSSFGGFLVTVLPRSPFYDFFNSWEVPEYLGWLNWFFPVSDCISILSIWLIAVSTYYIYSLLLRWIKAID